MSKLFTFITSNMQPSALLVLLSLAVPLFLLSRCVQRKCDLFFDKPLPEYSATGSIVLLLLTVISSCLAIASGIYPPIYKAEPLMGGHAVACFTALPWVFLFISDAFLDKSDVVPPAFTAALTVLALLWPILPTGQFPASSPLVIFSLLAMIRFACELAESAGSCPSEALHGHRLPGLTYCNLIACSMLGRNKFLVAVVALLIMGAYGIVSIDGDFWGNDSFSSISRSLFLAYCCICTLITYLWISCARNFRCDLEAPFGLVNDSGYRRLTYAYSAMCSMPRDPVKLLERVDDHDSDTELVLSSDRSAALFSTIWWIGWASYALFIVYCAICLNMPPIPTGCIVFAFLVVFFLNGSSYYLCLRYVWLLKEISKLPGLERFPHYHIAPTRSPIFKRLSDIASANSLFFFSVAACFALLMVISLFINPIGSPVATDPNLPFPTTFGTSGMLPAACTIGTVIIAVIGYGVIFFCSRLFLGRILDRWRDETTSKLFREYEECLESENNMFSSPALDRFPSVLAEVNAKDKLTRAEMLNFSLGIVTLAVNTAALVITVVGLINTQGGFW